MRIRFATVMASAANRVGTGRHVPTIRVFSAVILIGVTAACAPHKTLTRHHPVSRQEALAAVFQGAPTTQNLFMQCVVDTLSQHLPVALAVEACNNMIAQQLNDGIDRPLDPKLGRQAGTFDPAAIQANCGGADPHRADGPSLQGLSVPQLRFQMELWKDVRDASGDKEASKIADEYVQKIFEELERRKAAGENTQTHCSNPDPQHGCPAEGGRTTAEGSVCQQVAETARDLLRECIRVGWTRGGCASLRAQLKNCPDPTYAHVDPDVGVACEDPPDPKLVIDAWAKRCSQLTDGGTACGGMKPPEGGSATYTGGPGGICNDPRALLDPETSTCIAPLKVATPMHVDTLEEMILYAMTKFGGPTIVLPHTGPSPLPPGGGDPVPGNGGPVPGR